MNIVDYIESISVKCSPIINYNGKEVFLANISFLGDDGVGRYCGIQFPQKHLAYCRNFSRDEVEFIITYLSAQEDVLLEKARSEKPIPDEIPKDELYKILV